jgi:hypothetical protein
MAEIGALFDSMFIGTTAALTSQKWQNSFLKQITSCPFHILLTAQIWRTLTSGYSGVSTPPSWAKFDEPEQVLNAITELSDTTSTEE